MQKLLLLIFTCIALTSCVSKSEYKKKMSEAIIKMETVALSSHILADDHRSVWHKAIFDNTYDGGYCSDFNDALAKNKKRWDASDAWKKISRSTDELKCLIKELNEYPNDYKDAYNEIIEIYTLTIELNEIAVSPTGNLQSYTARIYEIYNNINNNITKFKVKYLGE